MFAILAGFAMYMTGGVLILTLIGIPFGIPLLAAGLGLMLEPKASK